MKILFGVKLILLFLLVFVFVVNNKQEYDASTNIVPVSLIDTVIALDEFSVSIQELTSLSKWNRNPFLPYYSVSSDNVENFKTLFVPELKSIFYEKGKLKAVVNNDIISQGESYLNMEVKYIGETIVVFKKENKEIFILQL